MSCQYCGGDSCGGSGGGPEMCESSPLPRRPNFTPPKAPNKYVADVNHSLEQSDLRILIATQALPHCYYAGISPEQLARNCFDVADAFIEESKTR